MSEHAMQQHHESARNSYETGRLRVAMSIIQECLHADSDDGRAWELSGLVHYSSGLYRQAVSSWACSVSGTVAACRESLSLGLRLLIARC